MGIVTQGVVKCMSKFKKVVFVTAFVAAFISILPFPRAAYAYDETLSAAKEAKVDTLVDVCGRLTEDSDVSSEYKQTEVSNECEEERETNSEVVDLAENDTGVLEDEGVDNGWVNIVSSEETSVPAETEHVHSYVADVVFASCEQQGFTEYTCNCGDSYVCDYTDPIGHNWSDWIVIQPATRETEGIESKSCCICEACLTQSIPVLQLIVPAGSGIVFNPTSAYDISLLLAPPVESDFPLFFEQAVSIYDAILSGVPELSVSFPRDVIGDISSMSDSEIDSGMKSVMKNFISVFTDKVLQRHTQLRFTRASYYAGTMEIDIQAIVSRISDSVSEQSVFTLANISAGLYSGMSERDAAVAINNWICDNIYYADTYLPPQDVLTLKYGNCSSYAILFHAMCQDVGIQCDVVTGTVIKNGESIGHAWNRVLLSGAWYYIDVCWNDTSERNQYLFTDIIWNNHIVGSIEDVYY